MSHVFGNKNKMRLYNQSLFADVIRLCPDKKYITVSRFKDEAMMVEVRKGDVYLGIMVTEDIFVSARIGEAATSDNLDYFYFRCSDFDDVDLRHFRPKTIVLFEYLINETISISNLAEPCEIRENAYLEKHSYKDYDTLVAWIEEHIKTEKDAAL